MKWVCAHGCCHSPLLVNGWWTQYLRRRPIEFHGLHGCKFNTAFGVDCAGLENGTTSKLSQTV